ncbi:MAG TPA: signal peptidase I [Actinomycetota bacterium]|nr:signal peptidase I [Actinomycetota bacterium]
MPRVHEVAKEIGISSRELIAHLDEIGAPVASHSSSIDQETTERVKAHIGNGTAEPTTALEVDLLPSDDGDDDDYEEEELPSSHRKKKSLAGHLAEIPLLVLFAFAIAIVIKTFLVQAFFIPSGSMLPTLRVGDRVLVEKLSYRFGSPARGDVVVFARDVFGAQPDLPWHQDLRNGVRELLGLPTGQEEDYIKRVVAVGGDTIRYSGSPRVLLVNGEEVEQPFIQGGEDAASPTLTAGDCKRLEMKRDAGGCIVPAGMVFVMGDNRGNSEDSRIIGPIAEDKIVGHAFVILWPPSDFAGL